MARSCCAHVCLCCMVGLYCILISRIVFYFIALYFIALYCTSLHCIALHGIAMSCNVCNVMVWMHACQCYFGLAE